MQATFKIPGRRRAVLCSMLLWASCGSGSGTSGFVVAAPDAEVADRTLGAGRDGSGAVDAPSPDRPAPEPPGPAPGDPPAPPATSSCAAIWPGHASPFPFWRWQSPEPQGYPLGAAWSPHPDEVWVAGNQALAHWDGREWTTYPTRASIGSLWGSGPDDLFATGGSREGHGLLHFDGSAWQDMTPWSPPVAIQQIWGISRDEAWALGGGQLWKREGSSFSLTPLQTPDEAAVQFWAASSSAIWLLTGPFPGGQLWHFDGTSWEAHPSTAPGDLQEVGGTGPDDVWARVLEVTHDEERYLVETSRQNTWLHWDGRAWETVELPFVADRLYTPAPGELLLRAREGNAYGFITAYYRRVPGAPGQVGEGWERVVDMPELAPGDPLFYAPWDQKQREGPFAAVAMAPGQSSSVFLAGQGGAVLHSRDRHPVALVELHGVIRAKGGSGPDALFAAGDLGTLLRYECGRWVPVELGSLLETDGEYPPALTAIGSSGPDDVWVAGEGLVLRWDGRSWQRVEAPALWFPRALLALAPDDVYLAGDGLWHFDGNDWTPLAQSPDIPSWRFSALWASSASDIWAASSETPAAIYHFDGQRWQAMPVAVEGREPPILLTALAGTAAGELWAAGPDGVQRFDGRVWTALPGLPTEVTPWGLWVRGPDDVFVGGSQVLHWDGSVWEGLGISGTIFGLDESLWVYGADGILHHQ